MLDIFETPSTQQMPVTSQAELKQAVSNQLQLFLTEQASLAATIGPEYADLLGTAQTLISQGGKRLRPLLALWSYGGYGGTDQPAMVRAAAALELFHAGILMHDDVIDRDLVRWGQPNISGQYVARLGHRHSAGRARQLADSYALLAGDCCIDLSYQQLLASGFPSYRLLPATNLLHHTFFRLLGGETLDLATSLASLSQLRADDLLAVARYKTATYSFGLPFELGARLAGAPSRSYGVLHNLANCLGVAYQLQDDLLGLFGDAERLGKSVISDLREGKRTLLMHVAYQRASRTNRQQLRRWLGNAKAGPLELAMVQSIVHETGAKQYVQELIAQYYRQATDLLPQAGWQAPFETELANCFSSLLYRQA